MTAAAAAGTPEGGRWDQLLAAPAPASASRQTAAWSR